MSLISPVIIGRMALSHISVRSNLENLSEKTPETGEINTWIDTSRRQTLEAFNWNFARRRQALAAHSEGPPLGQWGYRYQYPFQCLKVRALWHPDINPHQADAIPYEVELASDDSKSILTNLIAAQVLYTKDIEDLTLWTDSAIEAFSRALASHIAGSLTTQRNAAVQQLQLFNVIINAASSLDANEQMQQEPRDAPWIRSRL